MRLVTYYILIIVSISYYDSYSQSKPKELNITSVKLVSRVTGKSAANENFPNPNKTDVIYNVGGTDLGIAWDMGKGITGYFFGDTYGRDFKYVSGGGPGEATDWRSNVLGISSDKNLRDGLLFDKMIVDELISSPHITNGTGSHTAIPTAAIQVKGVDYVHVMDIRKWGGPGSWTTNHSTLYRSLNEGQTWSHCPTVNFSSNSKFSQVAYAKYGNFIYMLGTLSGRFGSAFLARFKQSNILNQQQYEYWNSNTGWIEGKEDMATPLIDGPIGEASLIYLPKYKRWILTYLNEKKGALVMRDAADITKAWSSEKIIASSKDYPGLYGAFIIPQARQVNKIYFNMSMWFPYNVFLMEATLKFAE